MIDFRVTDGVSFEITFSANTRSQFRVRCARAISDAANTGCSRLELHVMTSVRREWLSPNYPRSNSPLMIDWRSINTNHDAIWEMIVAHHVQATISDNSLNCLSAFMSQTPKLKIVK